MFHGFLLSALLRLEQSNAHPGGGGKLVRRRLIEKQAVMRQRSGPWRRHETRLDGRSARFRPARDRDRQDPAAWGADPPPARVSTTGHFARLGTRRRRRRCWTLTRERARRRARRNAGPRWLRSVPAASARRVAGRHRGFLFGQQSVLAQRPGPTATRITNGSTIRIDCA